VRFKSRTVIFFFLTGISAFMPLPTAEASDPLSRPSPVVTSIGQPPGVELAWGITTGYRFDEEQPSSRLNLGLHSEFLLPQLGFLDLTFEGGIGNVGSDLDGAVSAYLRFPYANPGIEYDFRDEKPYFKLTALGSPRRGGLLGQGDRLRVDYVPAKGWVQVGFELQQPFRSFRPNRPRNRQVHMDRVELPQRIEPTDLFPRELIAEARTAMAWMDRLLVPRLALYDAPSPKSRRDTEKGLEEIQRHIRSSGRLFAGEDSTYHATLDLAFTRVARGDTALGAALSAAAESVLFEDMVVPVNRLFSRLKKPVDLSSYSARAVGAFQGILAQRILDAGQKEAALEIIEGLLEEIEDTARSQKKCWNDSRLIWIPVNYGLRAGQIDTQEELNAAFERVVGLDLTPCNDIRYLFNDDFYFFYRDLLLETRHYQVTIVHDVRNRSGKGPDRVAWEIVATGYLEAFARAIREMDEGKRDDLPQFFLFLDEHYYRENRSARIISFLETLYKFPEIEVNDPALQAELDRQMADLARAAKDSPELNRRGERYLRQFLKVQINITNQFQPTFKEDAIARDHRKVAFRDAFEEDPSSGVGIFTGMGIGEHYFGPTWEDRGLVIRGPGLVELKHQARELFMSQGYKLEEVPAFLRPHAFPADYEARCRSLCESGWNAQVLTAMNQTGFQGKSASVEKMALYNLMPSGSVLLIPDSIWSSDYWASILFGAALRGLHVYAVAPDRDHAPSDAPPTLELIREVLASMMLGREFMAAEIKQAGGSIHLGVFDADYDVCDALKRVESFVDGGGFQRLAEMGLDLDPGLEKRYLAERDTLISTPRDSRNVTEFGRDRRTKLHQKTQFFATKEGIQILSDQRCAAMVSRYLEYQRGRCEGRTPTEGLGIHAGLGWDVTGSDFGEVDVNPQSRVAYFVTIGSQNQDRRSMILDGEVLVTVAGRESLIALTDFVFILGSAEWINNCEELNHHFPKEGGVLKTVTRWIRNLI